MTNEAGHFDSDKPRVDLLPPDALIEVAKVLGFGAKKYGDHNWLLGMSWLKLYGSTLRHLFKWCLGHDRDEESGLPHLAHAACDVLMLLTYTLRNKGTDTRYKENSNADS